MLRSGQLCPSQPTPSFDLFPANYLLDAMAHVAEELGIRITMDDTMQTIMYLASHAANLKEKRKQKASGQPSP